LWQASRLASLLFPTSVKRKEDILMSKQKGKPKVKPVHDIRLGRIKAAIWRNEPQTGTMFNVTISRLYRDGTQWRDSTSFGRDDLPIVAKVADMAHTWIFTQSQDQNGSNGHEPNGSQDDEQNGSSQEEF
jgi:hypothetical protein